MAEEFDNTQAWTEGWAIFTRSDAPPYAIERLDAPGEWPGSEAMGEDAKEVFASDDEAAAFVCRRAADGSAYHQAALNYLKQRSPVGYAWAMGRDA